MNKKENQLKELEEKLSALNKKYINEFESLDYYKRRALNEEIHKLKKEIEKVRRNAR